MEIFQMALALLVKDKSSCQKALELKKGIDNHILKEQYRIAREKCEELVRNFGPGFGRMGCLTGYELSEIISARIIGKRVHLDVSVKASS